MQDVYRGKRMIIMARSNRQAGFTLIELMITIVVVAILVGIALPAFQGQLTRGKRTAAQAEMMDIASRQQQFLLADRAYATKPALEASGFSFDPDVANHYNYAITVGSGTSPTFTITFTPFGSQASDGIMTLNEQGVGTPTEAWKR